MNTSEIAVSQEYKKSNMIIAGTLSILSYMIIACIPAASLAVLLPAIMTEMKLSASQAASFSAGVALGTSGLVFVAGVVLDKISTRLLMCIFGIVAALTVALRAFAMDFAFFYVIFPLFGICMAIIYPGCNKIIALWFPQKYLFTMNALIIGGGATAFIIGLNTTFSISSVIGGWRNYFVLLAIIMIILAVLWMLLFPERSSKDAALNKDIEIRNAHEIKFWQNIKNVISTPKVWLLCMAEFFFAGVIGASTALGTAAVYAKFEGALSVQMCGAIASTGNLSSLIGYIVLPTLLAKLFPKVDKIWPIMGSMVVSGILWSVAMGSNNNIGLIIFCFAFGAFWNGLGYSGPRTMLMELPEVAGLRAGTALGVFNTLSRIGVALIISFAGFLAVVLKGFNYAMIWIYLISILGAFCLLIYYFIVKYESRKSVK